MIDIIDRIEDEDRIITLHLANGTDVTGVSDCIVWGEDNDGWETVKKIRFIPQGNTTAMYYTLTDIISYDPND